MASVLSALENTARAQPGRVALHTVERTFTYGELDEVATRLASSFAALGVERGDRVAVMMPNWWQFHVVTHATWKAGGVEVPVNVMLTAEELHHLLADSGARVIVGAAHAVASVAASRETLPELRAVVAVEPTGVRGVLPFDELVDRGDPAFVTRAGRDDGLAIIAYTSGTTGFPKGTMLAHESLVVSMEVLAEYAGLGPDDNVLQVLPLFHSNASLAGQLLAWHVGSAAVLLERFEPAQFVEMVRRTRPAYFCMVPTLLYDVARGGGDLRDDFSSVRMIGFGGAPCPIEIRDEVERVLGVRLVQGYGMTEAPNIATLDPLDEALRPASAGRPLPYYGVRVLDADGDDAPVGERGEICLGPGRPSPSGIVYRPMMGYWGNPEATAAAVRDGWFHTGDIGYFDPDGYLYVVDRIKDMIIRGGNNVYPAEIERVLLGDPRVSEAYVVGIPHERLGEVPRAYVVLEPGAEVSAPELRSRVREHLAAYKQLDEVEFVDSASLPRNALGKVLKRELRMRSVAT